MKAKLCSYFLSIAVVLGLTHPNYANEKVTPSPWELLSDPADHPLASLSFELPLAKGELDPSATKAFLNTQILEKNSKFPQMSMEEPWQKNLHITITGFPNIPAHFFKDAEFLSQFEQVVREFKLRVNEMIAGKSRFQLDSEEPVKGMPYKTMKALFAIPSEEIKVAIQKMIEAFPIVFKGYVSTLGMAKQGKLGVHVSLDFYRKYFDSRTLETMAGILSKNDLSIAPVRATILYHTERWK